MDAESGLFYNRFRYYDPKSACYLSTDPIGLAGGHNNYAYVPNPTEWVDPFGLAGCGLLSIREIREKIELLRKRGVDVYAKSVEQARQILHNMPELRPC